MNRKFMKGNNRAEEGIFIIEDEYHEEINGKPYYKGGEPYMVGHSSRIVVYGDEKLRDIILGFLRMVDIPNPIEEAELDDKHLRYSHKSVPNGQPSPPLNK